VIDEELKTQPIRILIVEDNRVNMFLSKLVIEQVLPKAVLLEAQNGEIGVELFEKEKLDLILMDVEMPIMNGYEATKRIREIESRKGKDKQTPIIAITAGLLKNYEAKSFESGMDDLLNKPFDSDEFELCVTKWISH